MAQGFGLCASAAGGMGSILVRELRPHKLCGIAKNNSEDQNLKENTDSTVLNFKTSLWLNQTKPNVKQQN